MVVLNRSQPTGKVWVDLAKCLDRRLFLVLLRHCSTKPCTARLANIKFAADPAQPMQQLSDSSSTWNDLVASVHTLAEDSVHPWQGLLELELVGLVHMAPGVGEGAGGVPRQSAASLPRIEHTVTGGTEVGCASGCKSEGAAPPSKSCSRGGAVLLPLISRLSPPAGSRRQEVGGAVAHERGGAEEPSRLTEGQVAAHAWVGAVEPPVVMEGQAVCTTPVFGSRPGTRSSHVQAQWSKAQGGSSPPSRANSRAMLHAEKEGEGSRRGTPTPVSRRGTPGPHGLALSTSQRSTTTVDMSHLGCFPSLRDLLPTRTPSVKSLCMTTDDLTSTGQANT